MPQAIPLIVYAAVQAAGQALIVAQIAALAASVAVGALQAKRARKKAAADQKALQVVLQSGTEPHRTVYGRGKLSGALAYANSYADSQRLNRVIVLTGHEIDGYDSVWFNGDILETNPGTLPSSANFSSPILGGRYAPDGFSTAHVEGYVGTSSQAASSMLISASSGQWTSNHRLLGRAYLHVQNNYSKDVYTEGLPNVQAIVRGKKLYDPRTGLTGWSRNPALVIRDYLVNVLQVPSSRIDDAAFIAAANVCDEYVTLDTSAQGDPAKWAAYMTKAVTAGTWEAVGGTTYRQRRYTIDGVISADTAPGDVLEQMVFACGGYLSYTGGVWRLVAGSYAAPTLTLTEADLRGGPQFQPKPNRRDLANVIRGSFVGPMVNYEATDFQPLKATALIADDGGVEMPLDIDLPFTNDAAACQRIASIYLYRSRQGVLQFPATLTGLALRPGDTVAVTLPRFGFNGEVFRVEGWTLADDLGVDLVLREEAASIYTWTPSTTIGDPSPQLALPSPWSVPAITGLTATSGVAVSIVQNDGTIIQRTLVSWNTTTNGFANKIEIETRLVGATAWTPHPPANDSDGQAYLLNLKTLAAHEIRARRVNAIGARGAWATINYTPLPANAVANLLKNSDWTEDVGQSNTWLATTAALRNWSGGWSTATPQFLRNYDNGTRYNIGAGGMCLYDPSNVAGQEIYAYQDVPALAGVEYEASVYVGIQRATALLYLSFLDASKASIALHSDSRDSGSAFLGELYAPLQNPRLWVKATAPANTAYARVYCVNRVTASSSPWPLTAWSNALLCVAPAGVTRETATPWVSDDPNTFRGLGEPLTSVGTGHGCWDTLVGVHTIQSHGATTSITLAVKNGETIFIDIDYSGTGGAAGPQFAKVAADVVVSGSGKVEWHTDAADRTDNYTRNETTWTAVSTIDTMTTALQREYTAPADQTITVHAGGGAKAGGTSGSGTVRLRVYRITR